MSGCFSIEQLCEPPAASEQYADCLATGLPLANFPPPTSNRSGPHEEEVNGGAKRSRERENREDCEKVCCKKTHAGRREKRFQPVFPG